ncbi:sulfate ABC transporter permease subunit CysW [Arsenicitalea aurantiaca]|uniref:Sulfate ABC transporter permease subunit CysW n=1 Tax=Arsenicitalea aurantiaca TaxID=1783274 RepID=A0A433X3D0_9HYPH|nr:sulfate ABC transporter permease subunit CysW [Arsenicitalea aurantiaca]RUT28575.1 sulfate ABC transporter permease subunit CysW [Arsenicitalea aurantiaca]
MSHPTRTARHERSGPERVLIALAFVLSALVLVVPVALIFAFALREGFGTYFANILEPNTRHAIWLTVLTALIVVPINMVFGICAAWAVTRFRFPGRNLLITIIEIPFSVSPIVAGVIYLFLYGGQGLLGPTLQGAGIQLMFTVTAIFLVSLFVTAPFVARELIPLMSQQGSEDEEAALSLGANGWQMFWHVTLPNIRWALLYGAVLCNARVMGEFGAVSVVSGSIRGQTNTLPLQISQLFNDFNVTGAFAASSTLAFIALVTLILKALLEGRGWR